MPYFPFGQTVRSFSALLLQLVLVVFDDLGYETVVKLEQPAILGETITLRFMSADPHAGSVAFARVAE